MSTEQSTEEDRVSYWKDRWEASLTAFHMDKLHPTLASYKQIWLGDEKQTILFPLCGKTVDMKILHDEGHAIVGLEGVQQPIEEFAKEHQSELHTTPTNTGFQLCTFSSLPNLRIYQGDYFRWPVADSSVQVTRVFDRGSLVAIKPHLRDQYLVILDSFLQSGGAILFSTLGYEQGKMDGPPFSVDYDTVLSLFQTLKAATNSDYDVQLLAATPEVGSRFLKPQGGPLDDLVDYAILATKK